MTPNYRQDYQYLPAFNRFFKDIKVLHFIGQVKPWHYENVLASDLANFHQYCGTNLISLLEMMLH